MMVSALTYVVYCIINSAHFFDVLKKDLIPIFGTDEYIVLIFITECILFILLIISVFVKIKWLYSYVT